MMSLIWEMKTAEFFVIIRLVATKIQNCGNRLQLCVSLVKTAEENKKENEWGGRKKNLSRRRASPPCFEREVKGLPFSLYSFFPVNKKKIS